jgi:hypothetical protein
VFKASKFYKYRINIDQIDKIIAKLFDDFPSTPNYYSKKHVLNEEIIKYKNLTSLKGVYLLYDTIRAVLLYIVYMKIIYLSPKIKIKYDCKITKITQIYDSTNAKELINYA